MKCLQAWQQASEVARPARRGSGALSVTRNTSQAALAVHNKFNLNDSCATRSNRFDEAAPLILKPPLCHSRFLGMGWLISIFILFQRRFYRFIRNWHCRVKQKQKTKQQLNVINMERVTSMALVCGCNQCFECFNLFQGRAINLCSPHRFVHCLSTLSGNWNCQAALQCWEDMK